MDARGAPDRLRYVFSKEQGDCHAYFFHPDRILCRCCRRAGGLHDRRSSPHRGHRTVRSNARTDLRNACTGGDRKVMVPLLQAQFKVTEALPAAGRGGGDVRSSGQALSPAGASAASYILTSGFLQSRAALPVAQKPITVPLMVHEASPAGCAWT
jgi:hypothetical protein